MRRNFFKLTILAFILVIILPGFAASSQTISSAGGPPQKKERIVRVLVNDNGKLTEKDTIIVVGKGSSASFTAGNAVFKADTIILSGDGKTRESTVTVFVNDSKGNEEKDSVKTTYTFISTDSTFNKPVGDMKWLGGGKPNIIMKKDGGDAFYFQGPPARVHVGIPLHDPFSFDRSDPDIVSYSKKDIGKGQEKITIIRKKRTAPADINNVEMKIEK